MKTTTHQWRIWLILSLFLSPSTSFALNEAILKKDITWAIKEIPLSDKDALYDGESALHIAVEQELIPVIKMLILYKADVNAISAKGESAADIALELKNMKILKILVDNNGHLEKHKSTDLRAFVLLEEVLRSSDGRELFPFICPLFFMDVGVFRALRAFFKERKIDTWTIEDALGSFAVERFPSGHPSEEAIVELRGLLEEINTSKRLQTRIYRTLENRPYEVQINFPRLPLLDDKKPYKIAGLNVVKLARALTIKESKFFKSITTWNFADWIHGVDSQTEIYKFLTFSVNSSTVLTHSIKKYSDQKDRASGTKEIVKLGREFLKLNNLSGVKMIVAALSELTAMEIINLKRSDKITFKKLDKLVSQDDNYEEYHKHLSNLSCTQPYVPVLEVFLTDLRNYYDINQQLINMEYLNKIAATLQKINAIKNRSDYDFNHYDELNTYLDDTPFNYCVIKD